MTPCVLVTQCLQRDFVQPLGPHEAVPNALHVGRAEALRLVGIDPAAGPLAQLMHWARAQDPERLQVLHIRDWHDAADPHQARHLERFGAHCLAGSRGAELVLGLDAEVAARPNERFVDALTLNDFEGTSLGPTFEELRARAAGPLRVGVVGVWTEAKVKFLLYELLTRCGITDLATCSALTASASRSQHFNALEQIRKILGVTVCDSIGAFTEWLLPDGHHAGLPAAAGAARAVGAFAVAVDLDGDGRDDALHREDHQLLSLLYRDCARVELANTPLLHSGVDF